MKLTKARSREGEVAISISPLIDIVFILLIFFIVTTVFVEESGIGIQTPDSVPPDLPLPDREPLVVRIAKGGAIFLGEKEIGYDGIALTIRDALNRGDLDSVTIEAHPEARMHSVARLLDLCNLAEVEKVVTRTTEIGRD